MTANLDEQWKLVDSILDAVGLGGIPKDRMRSFDLRIAVDEAPTITISVVPENSAPIERTFDLQAIRTKPAMRSTKFLEHTSGMDD